MKKLIWLVGMALVLVCCKGKKVSLSGHGKVNADDFIAAFETVTLPYQVTDNIFSQKFNDSSLISYAVFTQFVPDTVISKYFGKEDEPEIYPLARIKTDDRLNYLICDAITDEKELVYLICLDKSNRFIASKTLIVYEKNLDDQSIALIDSKLTITITHQHRNKEGELKYKKDAYILSDAGKFVLILTESNEAVTKDLPVINPIDTLAHKHKYAGDYLTDKRNLISIRDGKNPKTFLFFIHFEKDNGTCNGELKGQARFLSPTKAEYHGDSSPCTIDFTFGENSISMKEIDGCGNYRDIKCFFDGTYYKKKEIKAKAMKKKQNG